MNKHLLYIKLIKNRVCNHYFILFILIWGPCPALIKKTILSSELRDTPSGAPGTI